MDKIANISLLMQSMESYIYYILIYYTYKYIKISHYQLFNIIFYM
jgi:hypothetical protein